MKSLANNGHEWNMKKLNETKKLIKNSIESEKKNNQTKDYPWVLF